MVQFIRFGDNAHGKEYLKHLDNIGKQDQRSVCHTIISEPLLISNHQGHRRSKVHSW